MKFTKKLFAAVIALCLMLCLSVAAFADDATPTTDQKTVTIHKVYKATNAETTSPAETFTLVQVGDGRVTDGDATSAPAIPSANIVGAEFAEGDAATGNGTTRNITITLPDYEKVGVYEYTLQEVAGTTAGVDYHGNSIKLVVTVINGENGKLRVAGVHTETSGEKSDSFENTYSAGKLNISKTVEGNLGDKDKYFEFKVTLTGEEGKTYGETYAVSGGSNASNPTSIEMNKETTFKLKHNETITIANLPYGVHYTVTETPVDKYQTTKTGDTGTINAATQTAAFANTKNGTIDMGVTLDNLPYILVLAAVLGGAVVMFTRKRRFED